MIEYLLYMTRFRGREHAEKWLALTATTNNPARANAEVLYNHAKLAEMLAEEGRRLGFVVHIHPRGAPDKCPDNARSQDAPCT